MTEAALPVTERAVERLAEAYLVSLGATVRKDGRRWSVTLPEGADTDLPLDGATLVVTNDPDEVDDEEIALAPESGFVERLIDEVAERHQVGSLAFTGEALDLRLPPWLEAGDVDIVERSFTPYYDRRALCSLFHVGIETVSEYQSEELRAVAIDLDSNERRPGLARTYLEVSELDGGALDAGPTLARDEVAEALDVAREVAEGDIAQTVADVRERATRAAEVELEEYREFVRQRLAELDGEIDRLTERIQETTATVESATEQGERVEALRQRKELRSEREDLQDERDDLREALEANFPERRREVRDRHALTVRLRPVAVAGVSYERGDLDVTLRDGGTTVDASFAYAAGLGVTDRPRCARCETPLSEDNPVAIDGPRLVGDDCCR
jgi:hypothetical protein